MPTSRGATGSRLFSSLDNIANRLESRGLLKEAEGLDAVSNSVEASMLAGLMKRIGGIMARLGIRSLPTPMDAAKTLSKVPAVVIKKLYDLVVGDGPSGGGPHQLPGMVPALAYGESSAAAPATMVLDPQESEWGVAEGHIPSELERLSHGEQELLPHFLSVLNTVAEQKNRFPSEQEIKEEIENMIAGVQFGTGAIMARSASVLVQRIDDIAGRLEARGLLKEARDLDVISNTLEALAADDPGTV